MCGKEKGKVDVPSTVAIDLSVAAPDGSAGGEAPGSDAAGKEDAEDDVDSIMIHLPPGESNLLQQDISF